MQYFLIQGLHLYFLKLHVLFLHCWTVILKSCMYYFLLLYGTKVGRFCLSLGYLETFFYVRMDQIPPPEEKEDHRPPEDQGDNSLVIDEEKPNEGRINFSKYKVILFTNLFQFHIINDTYAVFGTVSWFYNK